MKDYLQERYDRADTLRERIDVLFPTDDRGYGDDMRRSLRLADNYAEGVTGVFCDSVHRIIGELLDRMEADDREEKAEDAYWSAVHDAQVGA